MQMMFGQPVPYPVMIELRRDHPNRYHDNAVWKCANHRTGESAIIHGGLAQILEKYPDNFELLLIAAPTKR